MPVTLLAGLGFGDEGKGSCTDYLARQQPADVVVRYNGGPQAAHNVVTRHFSHTFSQFGSGTLAGSSTHLSRYMLIEPLALENEHSKLLTVSKPTVEADCVVISPYQILANRGKETLRKVPHGSCGLGVGETMEDSLNYPDLVVRASDMSSREVLTRKLTQLKELKYTQLIDFYRSSESARGPSLVFEGWPEVGLVVDRYLTAHRLMSVVGPEYLASLIKAGKNIIFEGAQGVLLDQDYGFHPHTTWSDTTFGNAMKLLDGYGDVKRVGIFRGYMTRHGAGPFPTEVSDGSLASDVHNGYGRFQGHFRLGHFDMVLAKYALDVIGTLDELYITNLDKVGDNPKVCTKYDVQLPGKRPLNDELTRVLWRAQPFYEQLGSRVELVDRIESELGVEVTLCSVGSTAEHKFSKMDTRWRDR